MINYIIVPNGNQSKTDEPKKFNSQEKEELIIENEEILDFMDTLILNSINVT